MESFTINSSQIIYRNNDKIQLIQKNKEIDNIKLEQKLFEIKEKNSNFKKIIFKNRMKYHHQIHIVEVYQKVKVVVED